jgi:hypothetical protein
MHTLDGYARYIEVEEVDVEDIPTKVERVGGKPNTLTHIRPSTLFVLVDSSGGNIPARLHRIDKQSVTQISHNKE